MERTKIHPERRAVYRETARRIMNADRLAKKHGSSQNTIGEIERALVAAYREGLDGQDSNTRPVELTWLQIPPRSRDTLSSLTFWFSAQCGNAEDEPSQIERFDKAGKPRWRTVEADGTRAEHSVSNGSVQPLIRLALLEPSTPKSNIFRLTEKGIGICRDYWARYDNGDPSLPKINVR